MRRVSSAAITSASVRARTIEGLASATSPIGVAASTRTPSPAPLTRPVSRAVGVPDRRRRMDHVTSEPIVSDAEQLADATGGVPIGPCHGRRPDRLAERPAAGRDGRRPDRPAPATDDGGAVARLAAHRPARRVAGDGRDHAPRVRDPAVERGLPQQPGLRRDLLRQGRVVAAGSSATSATGRPRRPTPRSSPATSTCMATAGVRRAPARRQVADRRWASSCSA